MMSILTRLKDPKQYTLPVKKLLKVISYDKEKIHPFGSFTYRSQPYPGDIDSGEEFIECCGQQDAITQIAKKIQRIIKKVLNAEGFYFADFKAGIDPLYFINIGYYDQDKLYNFNPEKILLSFTEQYKNGLLTKQEFKERKNLVDAIIDKHSRDDWENLDDLVKDKYRIKWTADELIKGKKELPGERIVKLEDTLLDKTNIRLDVFAPLYGKYLEVSNFILADEINKKGDFKPLNYKFSDMIEDLKKDIEKYSFSPSLFKPLKVAKRMWSVARLTKNLRVVEKLLPLLRSSAALLSQVSSELETISKMLHLKLPKKTIQILIQQVDEFRNRLANIIDIDLDQDEISNKLNSIISSIKNKKYNNASKKLKKLKSYFQQLSNEYSLSFMRDIGMFPPPAIFLP